jgi:hypothetical protein
MPPDEFVATSRPRSFVASLLWMTTGRHAVWTALVLAALILLPRGLAISRHQNERYDDEYHLSRGVAFWQRSIENRPMNDPPLGDALGAVPLVVTGSVEIEPGSREVTLYGHRLSPETLLNLIGLWKSLLCLPLIAVAFLWIRELYGLRSAWLAVALLLIEPTFAAHVPLPTIDVLGAEGIVIACYAVWKYLQRPTVVRLSLASFAVAGALLLKSTVMILPGVAALLALVWYAARFFPRLPRFGFTATPTKRVLLHIPIGIVVLPFSIWALTLFDVSVPLRQRDVGRFDNKTFIDAFRRELPAGIYLRSIPSTFDHASAGHPNFLNGERGRMGRWDYFPVVATYKLPIGIAAIVLIGFASFFWRRPHFDECSLALPAICWTALMLHTDINIGFRHFLPALVFLLLLSTRMLADRSRWVNWVVATLVALAFIETLRVHPNYLSYTNGLRSEPYRAITDSNLDWGQGLKSVRRWAARQKRPVSLAFFGSETPHTLEHYLGDTKVRVVLRPSYTRKSQGELPTAGLFIVSPTCWAGSYDPLHRLDPLWSETPVEVIDGSLLVYDLDEIVKRRPNLWTASTTRE